MAGVSERETEVLAALRDRLTNAQIARRLHISVRTVESHVSSLLRKYGVADRRELGELAPASPRGEFAGLPAPRTSFIGREEEREAIRAALAVSRLVTVTGPGGVGKTRLAARFARDHGLPGGYADLVPVGADFLVQAVAATLAVTEHAPQSLEDAVIAHFGREPALLVLDNCEHLLDAAAGFADRILSACPGVRILATSRERLGVPGERVVPLGPLPLGSDAESLFRDRALAADPGFHHDPAAVTALCARLDGMPLAIELAAARASALGAAGLLAALSGVGGHFLQLLAGGRAADERHRSLRAVIAWSHDLLGEHERALFRRLAVFAGRFDLDAAVAVAAHPDRAVVADILGRLVDKSLVAHERAANRWRMLETVRAYALDELGAGPDAAEVADLHLTWAAGTASALLARPHDSDRRAEFDIVADDLRAALAAAPEEREERAHRLARGLGRLTYARRFLHEALGHYVRAARLAPLREEAVHDLHGAAAITHAIEAPEGAYRLLLDAAAEAREAGDSFGLTVTLAWALVTANRFPGGFRERPERAHLDALRAEAIAAHDPSDPVAAAHLAAATSWSSFWDGTGPDRALAEAATRAAHAIGDPMLVSTGLDAQCAVSAAEGRIRDAHHDTLERLAVLSTAPREDPRGAVEIVDVINTAATYALAAGDLPAALSVARRALTDDLVGDHTYLAASTLVPPLALAGDYDAALAHAETAWTRWIHTGRPANGPLRSAFSAAALAHGMRGDLDGHRLWRARAEEANYGPPRPFAGLVDVRVAVHTGVPADPSALVAGLLATTWSTPASYLLPAAIAELAIVAGLPGAAALLARAAPMAVLSDWASACLARANGRLSGDAGELERSVRLWEKIGARAERAITLLLLPGGEAEGTAELREMGCAVPRG
ncbi:hypothetical protein Afil01_44770 [Actinorhabdospora filicis]|uniref:HTH luxR-type domain-containing protein n=1 Tax=Actinorhabdospora filicis TaxID=1785913 RepID=A0A9W6WCD5_9ACTN|nr:LuxR C-terminal-related transcriptional regulator [Actinorhabdospora filicis]GLZ79670.1 hypothetical protein Afil01_44770 [Actinorhabdospora filicis]